MFKDYFEILMMTPEVLRDFRASVTADTPTQYATHIEDMSVASAVELLSMPYLQAVLLLPTVLYGTDNPDPSGNQLNDAQCLQLIASFFTVSLAKITGISHLKLRDSFAQARYWVEERGGHWGEAIAEDIKAGSLQLKSDERREVIEQALMAENDCLSRSANFMLSRAHLDSVNAHSVNELSRLPFLLHTSNFPADMDGISLKDAEFKI